MRKAAISGRVIGVAFLPWAPHFLEQRRQVSRLFHTKPFAWDEVAKACYQMFAPGWEDVPASSEAAWAVAAASLGAAAAMLVWGRGRRKARETWPSTASQRSLPHSFARK